MVNGARGLRLRGLHPYPLVYFTFCDIRAFFHRSHPKHAEIILEDNFYS